MKWIPIFILFVSHQSFCMLADLKAAITASNLQKVQRLIGKTKPGNQLTESEPLYNGPVNFSQLHQFATQLTAERQSLTEHRSHPAVYNRFLMGGGTIVISLLVVGNYFYQAFTTKQANLQSLCAAGGAGITAIVHGCKEINLGIQNHDANVAHANHLAITHLLLNAHIEQDSEKNA